MGLGSTIKRAARRVERQVGNQVDRAKDPNRGIWGDSEWARYAERLTGASTFKSAVYRHTGGELDGHIDTQSNPVGSAKEDARRGRPTLAYGDTVGGGAEMAQAAATARKAEITAALEERKNRLAEGVILRRRRRAETPGTKGGTLLTGQLGVPGGANAFGALLGL